VLCVPTSSHSRSSGCSGAISRHERAKGRKLGTAERREEAENVRPERGVETENGAGRPAGSKPFRTKLLRTKLLRLDLRLIFRRTEALEQPACPNARSALRRLFATRPLPPATWGSTPRHSCAVAAACPRASCPLDSAGALGMRRHVSVTSSWLPARIATCRVASDTHCHSTPSASDRCRPVCGTLAGGGKVSGGEGRRGRARGGGREGEEEGEREKGREG